MRHVGDSCVCFLVRVTVHVEQHLAEGGANRPWRERHGFELGIGPYRSLIAQLAWAPLAQVCLEALRRRRDEAQALLDR